MPVSKDSFSLLPLEHAVSSLHTALKQPKNEFIRDSVIQRFEYSFELSWKTLKRYFETFQNLEEFNIPEIFRKAARQNLIDSSEDWFEFHRGRNKTSHVYSEKVAEEVYEIARKFLPKAEGLVAQLKKVLNDSSKA